MAAEFYSPYMMVVPCYQTPGGANLLVTLRQGSFGGQLLATLLTQHEHAERRQVGCGAHGLGFGVQHLELSVLEVYRLQGLGVVFGIWAYRMSKEGPEP